MIMHVILRVTFVAILVLRLIMYTITLAIQPVINVNTPFKYPTIFIIMLVIKILIFGVLFELQSTLTQVNVTATVINAVSSAEHHISMITLVIIPVIYVM